MIECDEHIVSTQHVCDWVESGRLFVEMMFMAATAKRDFVRDDNKKRFYSASHFDTMLTSTAESSYNGKTYVLPDGNLNTVRGSFVKPQHTARLRQG